MTPDDGRPLVSDTAANASPARLKIIDCDVHHALRAPSDLYPYMARRWHDHIENFGRRLPIPFQGSSPYPKVAPALSRTDAWPANGGPPGSDLAFMQEQLLDRYNVEYGLLHLLSGGMDERNQDLASAVCSAINDWQYEHWTQKDSRLKAAIVVPGEDPQAALAEMARWAGNTDFVQVAMTTHAIEPLGRRRYWPIYEAAEAYGLPLGLHTSGFNGHAITGSGWSSFYVEEQHNVALSQQQVAISLVCEGVFERFPALKAVIIEAGYVWVPSVAWRLDQHWERMKGEVPHLSKKPSEYFRSNLWYSSQPADEPERPEDLRQVLDWIGWDRLLFSTDYPHWDMDNPEQVFKLPLSRAEKQQIYNANARVVYKLA